MTSGYTQHKQAAGKKKVQQKRKAGAARSLESQVYISANAVLLQDTVFSMTIAKIDYVAEFS